MKTFEEFVNEGMASHYLAHYAKAALRSVIPRIQRHPTDLYSKGDRQVQVS